MKELVPVLAAAIGAIAALLGGWLSAWRQAELEAQKIELEKTKIRFTQEAALQLETRQSIQECIGVMASATHSMCWLSWLATIEPARITEERLAKYDGEMHETLPRAIAKQALSATYSAEIGKKLSGLLTKIEDLDARLGESVIRFCRSERGAVEKIIKHHDEAIKLHDELESIANTLNMKGISAQLS